MVDSVDIVDVVDRGGVKIDERSRRLRGLDCRVAVFALCPLPFALFLMIQPLFPRSQ
jgi:hypothetical protein